MKTKPTTLLALLILLMLPTEVLFADVACSCSEKNWEYRVFGELELQYPRLYAQDIGKEEKQKIAKKMVQDGEEGAKKLLQSRMNELGSKGWEFVGTTGKNLVFKRIVQKEK